MRSLNVILVSPPLAEPRIPNLGIEILASLSGGRHRVQTLHAPLLQPKSFGIELVYGIEAPAIFAPSYHGLDPEVVADESVRALRAEGHPEPALDEVHEKLVLGMNDAELLIRRIADIISAEERDVVGFSIGFDSQKLPAAAIARELRRRGCSATVVAGGTGTDGDMGRALAERFPEYDAVLRGEADRTWPRLLEAISTRADVSDIPGCIARSGSGLTQAPEPSSDSAFLDNPEVDYRAFLGQKESSAYRDQHTILLFETSRGCWWGLRKHCTFCGIKSVDEEYRTLSPSAAIRRITHLHDTYLPDILYATDAIAPNHYWKEVWPRLAREKGAELGRSLFYEIKSNQRRQDVARIAAAGFGSVQPGIESFSTEVLNLMNKGATALHQVAMLKWAEVYGIRVEYGLLLGTPGETAAHLTAMARLMPRIHHLRPPRDINQLCLHRFSPYFASPDQFGIGDIPPLEIQRVLYRGSDQLLERLCYQLGFRVPEHEHPDYLQAATHVREAVTAWERAWTAGATLYCQDVAGGVVIGRGDSADGVGFDLVSDRLDIDILHHSQDVTSLRRLLVRLDADAPTLRSHLTGLENRGLVLTENDHILALPVPADADAYRDARIEQETEQKEEHMAALGTKGTQEGHPR